MGYFFAAEGEVPLSDSFLQSSRLGDEQSAHASAGAATERVAKLEALEAVAACTNPWPSRGSAAVLAVSRSVVLGLGPMCPTSRPEVSCSSGRNNLQPDFPGVVSYFMGF